jgi:hypothetical protein
LKTVWKGCAFSFLFYGRQDTKSVVKRPRFAKTLSNTLTFTCSWGNIGSSLKGNRLYVPYLPLRPTSKLESFWELQVSAESGAVTTPSWPNPSMKPQEEGEQEHLVWGREQEKASKEIKKALTNAPALGLPDVIKPFFLYVCE